MTQLAIVHNETRVVRRLTVDESPALAPDESAVVLSEPLDFSAFPDGRVRLDADDSPVDATVDEWRAAGNDHAYNNAQRRERVASLKANLVTAQDAIQTLNKNKSVTKPIKTAMNSIGAVLADLLATMS